MSVDVCYIPDMAVLVGLCCLVKVRKTHLLDCIPYKGAHGPEGREAWRRVTRRGMWRAASPYNSSGGVTGLGRVQSPLYSLFPVNTCKSL